MEPTCAVRLCAVTININTVLDTCAQAEEAAVTLTPGTWHFESYVLHCICGGGGGGVLFFVPPAGPTCLAV